MRPNLPERFRRPPQRKNDIIRVVAGLSIAGAELAYRIDGGSYDTPHQIVIYSGAAVALGLIAMPLNRFGDNYYANLRYQELELDAPSEGNGDFYANGNSPYLEPLEGDLE